jgi:hypothetical protein
MFSKALVFFSLISVAFATVYVTAPVATTTYQAGKNASVNWMDNNVPPTLAQFGLSKISIYVGNAKQQTSLQLLNPGIDVSQASSINFIPDPTIGPDGSEYFIRFESLKFKVNGTQDPAEAFSALFTLSGMTGTFASSVQLEIAGQSTAPLAGQSPSGSSSTPSSTGSSVLTQLSQSNTPTGTSSTTSATAKSSSGATRLKAGWMVFGAVVGITMF